MAKSRRRGKNKAVPKQGAPEGKSVPPWAAAPKIGDRQISWKFSKTDSGGPWSWTEFPDDRLRELITKFANFETMDANALKHGRHWSLHPVDTLSKAARDRLIQIGRDDLDRLISFHLDGMARVWCCEYESIMFVLWWDPDHTVYPVEKKHT